MRPRAQHARATRVPTEEEKIIRRLFVRQRRGIFPDKLSGGVVTQGSPDAFVDFDVLNAFTFRWSPHGPGAGLAEPALVQAMPAAGAELTEKEKGESRKKKG